MLRIFVLFLFLFVSACSSERPEKDLTTLLGPYTATGTLTATGASLYRRGTHLLHMNGRPRFFLESKSVNLNEFQDTYVVVQGELSPNTHTKFLPVIQVSEVRKVDAPVEEEMQEYTIDSLGLSLSAPSLWRSEFKNGRFTFTLATETAYFIAIEKGTDVMIPEGIPVRIAGRNGVRVVEEGRAVHRVYVSLEDGGVLLFTFGPKGEDSLKNRDAFYTMLQSVRFEEQKESIESKEEKEAKEFRGSKQPCGGPAGVLCPQGEFCEVREMDTGIGICRAL